MIIDLTNQEADGLPAAEKKRLVQAQIHKLDRDIKRLDYASYITLILAFLTHDIVIITMSALIAYALSEKAMALESKKLKLQKQFKHLI